jgi:hypothetical protein
MSKAIRSMVQDKLGEMGYYPIKAVTRKKGGGKRS